MSSLFTTLLLIFLAASAIAGPLPTIFLAPPVIDEKAVDRDIDPCDDFYQFACGSWLRSTPLPLEKAIITRTDSYLEESNEQILREILESFSHPPPQNKNNQSKLQTDSEKASDFYLSCLRGPSQNSIGFLQESFRSIEQIQSKKDLSIFLSQMHLHGIPVLFALEIHPDLNNPSFIGISIARGEFGLSGREAFFSESHLRENPRRIETLAKYTEHIEKLFERFGKSKAEARTAAQTVLQIESQLAQASYSQADRQDLKKTNHPMSLKSLAALVQTFDWENYFASLSGPQTIHAHFDHLIVDEPDYLRSLNRLFSPDSSKSLKIYLQWQLLRASTLMLGGEFEKQAFDFESTFLLGKKQMPERWKTCVQIVAQEMPDVLAKSYVQRIGGKRPREIATRMIDEIKTKFQTEMIHQTWLDPSTRTEASRKLALMRKKVGFPEHWKTYDSLTVTELNGLKNLFEARADRLRKKFLTVGNSSSTDEFEMPPWTIDASYDSSLNQLVFPLAQLLPPFLDPQASPAANWGALGSTLGHEMSHAYDDEGHLFDAQGRLRNWWSPKVKARYTRKLQCFIDQAKHFEILPGLHLDAKFTLDENIADQVGTRFAFLTYKSISAKEKSNKTTSSDELMKDQQFFLSYAQSQCSQTSEQRLRLLASTDSHPPPPARVNLVLQNLKSFRQAFHCHVGQKMAPAKTCSMW